MIGEHGCATGSQAIRPTPVGRFECLDETLRLEPGEGLVEGARREVDAGELFDVLHEGVTVLVPSGQARKDQRGRTGAAADAIK